MEINNVTIIGCGALGIMYASVMLKTLSPERVCFAADETRAERYRREKFFANGKEQNFRFVTPEEAEPADLVIFAVKAYALDEAVALAKNFVGEETIILSVLNGISSEEIIGKTFCPAKIIPCMVAGMDATRITGWEGASVNFSRTGCVSFGALAQNEQRDIDALAEFFTRVKLEYKIEADIIKTIWWKFMMNVGVNPASAVLRAPYRLFQTNEHAIALAKMAMMEAVFVAQASGIRLTEADMDAAIALTRTLSPDGKTSMCQDAEAGRKTEIDIFAGEVVRRGHGLGVATPVNEFLYHAVKALETGGGERL